MRVFLSLTASIFCLLPTTSFADLCVDVVADTVAEIRAGATDGWSDDAESLARAAAGSACIKAQSGRYGVAAQAAEGVTVSSVPKASAKVAESTSPSDSSTSDEPQADDGSWSVGGLTFRSMSGSPTQKPYERQRQSKKEEE